MYSVAELTTHLDKLGVQPGETLLVQASLRAVGPVADGARGVAEALRGALGADGTLVVYTATPENSRTSSYYRADTAGMSPAQLRNYHARMPAWDLVDTPASPTLGRLSEEVRQLPGARRSGHPQTSFAAIGPLAEWLTRDHRWRSHLGPESPAQRLYESGARCLMIGVPVWCCTPLHLLEYWQPDREDQHYRCVVRTPEGRRQWRSFTGTRLRDEHFPAMGEVLAAGLSDLLESGPVGDAHCFLMPIREAVDLADKWYRTRPS
ncbi:aminoglycoside N(3)-acetyltransferase [Streptomyces sp. TLI_171]|uniref:aminoglycoside N(3)-acetyltransferase n=1 Tax=Streptomyces sp. TLI_171 TaxID=1938859 RepID=UPI000C1A5D68|nr:AAC(3) family N-acetyltransferase [Streptomyces sp. TLI_171]RKE20674.1 aminoglycoside 3-N-acetyltransferase [Streptomyces sp. TLI_171]